MDGVLIDSTPAMSRVWRQWAQEKGINPDLAVRTAHGRPSIDSIRQLLPGGDAEKENLEVERREVEDVAGVVPLPGAIELLRSLPYGRWAIVTSCTPALAEARIRASGLPHPAGLITTGQIVQGKPHPEPYLKGAASIQTAAEDCLIVEDVPVGVRAGKAAGARVAALLNTAPKQELLDAGADWVIQDCRSIRVVNVEADHIRLALDRA
jgi:sugar-phosphatase